MVQLTDSDIAKFQALYKDHFGIDLSVEDARQEGMKLVRFMLLLCDKPCDEKVLEPKLIVNHNNKII